MFYLEAFSYSYNSQNKPFEIVKPGKSTIERNIKDKTKSAQSILATLPLAKHGYLSNNQLKKKTAAAITTLSKHNPKLFGNAASYSALGKKPSIPGQQEKHLGSKYKSVVP